MNLVKADLLLVEGNPMQDILATCNIVAVWKRGVPGLFNSRGTGKNRASKRVSFLCTSKGGL